MGSPRYIKKRCYKNFDDKKFVQEVKETSMLDLYLCQDGQEGEGEAANSVKCWKNVRGLAELDFLRIPHRALQWRQGGELPPTA